MSKSNNRHDAGAKNKMHSNTLQETTTRNYNTRTDRAQARIFKLLGTGADNATTAADLAAALNTTPRHITREIRAERLAGFPIASSSAGYYRPTSRAESAAVAKKLHERAAEIHRVAVALERAAAADPNQVSINI